MILDLKLNDPDRDMDFEIEVNARVVEEIGGQPGYCVDIDALWVSNVVVYFDKQWHELAIEYFHRRSLTRYVERMFDDEIRRRCIERFEELKLGAA